MVVQKRNPEHRRGERNGLCPHYGVCLDEAVKKSWQYWDCCNCCHSRSRDPGIDGFMEENETMPYYSVPEKIFEKVC